MRKNESMTEDQDDSEETQGEAMRASIIAQGKEERGLMTELDDLIMASDLPIESLERVLNYLADRHLNTRLAEPEQETPLQSIASAIADNLPQILALGIARPPSPPLDQMPLTPMRPPMPEKPKDK